jgi:hypothetical protein
MPGGGMTAAHGNNGSCKATFSQQGMIGVIAVKVPVARKGRVMQFRMKGIEIPKDGEQCL